MRPFDEGGGHAHDAPACAAGPAADDDVAAVYRALRRALPPDVDVELVAPSNWIFLLPELVAGGRRAGLRGGPLRRSVRAGLAVSSLLVDGRVITSGGLPSPAAAVHAVRTELALA
ncbi:hypothetical protein OF117_11145 [Geodermatophilus sp. YIM 151500]|uniref:hypothetical protein n=1 Tax=Geodermatophilus sp. YIM 151500 TaxID=2984531 RepID=UPI0021E3788E|nr:hypothetical protein [Geodermatophilus sp. YIM 151500]MCV2489919.1 hypothetical protein [Geodermatophilus sp. YIM 151500]